MHRKEGQPQALAAEKPSSPEPDLHDICFAGGCFWGYCHIDPSAALRFARRKGLIA